jgi:hypothetical protein
MESREDVMQEWMMVDGFLRQTASDRLSLLHNITEDKRAKAADDRAQTERNSQLAMKNEKYDGVLSYDGPHPKGTKTGEEQQKFWYKWYHVRFLCQHCLAILDLDGDKRCRSCGSPPRYASAPAPKRFIADPMTAKDAADLHTPVDQLLVHLAWRSISPLYDRMRVCTSVTAYHTALKESAVWIRKLKGAGISTVAHLAQARSEVPLGLETVFRKHKVPIELADVCSR